MSAPDFPGTLPIVPAQPMPLLTLKGRHNGVTGITRVWPPAVVQDCALCDQCKAAELPCGGAVCTVFTTENVSDESAELYSLRGVPPGDLEVPSREDLGGLRITSA